MRPARVADAPGIGGVYVEAWRNAYAGLLPAEFLARMSTVRHAARFESDIRRRRPVLVAETDDRIVGFCAGGVPRVPGLAEAEVETLYVLDDWRDQGLGRQLMHAVATRLSEVGCGSVFLWVLEQNPSRWFYERLGGRPVRRSTTQVAGQMFDQTAYVWDPIARLLTASEAT